MSFWQTKVRKINFTAVVLLLTIGQVTSATESQKGIQVVSIHIHVTDIYRDSKESWALDLINEYHTKTKRYVIDDLLPMQTGDWVTPKQLFEAERLLREQSYLRDADVTLSEDGILKVTVVDNWTLFPTVSFSRTGRKNKSSVGIRDSNLLGLGIATTLKYKSDAQKSGYRLRISSPTRLADHSYASIVLENYDVGTERAFSFDKPFYSIDSKTMFQTSVRISDIENTYYQNDDEIGVALTEGQQFNIQYGWLNQQKSDTTFRTVVGLSTDSIDLKAYSSAHIAHLFDVREKTYLWWGKEQFQSRFQVLNNIYFIKRKEDINLGLLMNYKIGLGKITLLEAQTNDIEISPVKKSALFKLDYKASFGNEIGSLLLLQKLHVEYEFYNRQQLENYFSIDYNLDVFYPVAANITLFNGNNFSYLSQFRKTPHSLGGDSGLRGFPTQYQYGRKRWLSTFEVRYYPEIELWRTFAFGWVGFIDVGRAWNNPASENMETNTLSSIGIGFRIFPKVSSGTNVIHIDFARPNSNNSQINDWQWRIQVKNSF